MDEVKRPILEINFILECNVIYLLLSTWGQLIWDEMKILYVKLVVLGEICHIFCSPFIQLGRKGVHTRPYHTREKVWMSQYGCSAFLPFTSLTCLAILPTSFGDNEPHLRRRLVALPSSDGPLAEGFRGFPNARRFKHSPRFLLTITLIRGRQMWLMRHSEEMAIH